MKKAIAYYRLPPQLHSSRGQQFELQENAVRAFAEDNGYKLIDFFTDTSHSRERFTFVAALQKCRLHAATLLFASLDVLGGSEGMPAARLVLLIESAVDFRITDNPSAHQSIQHLVNAVPLKEREAFSERIHNLLAVMQFVHAKKQQD